MTYVHPQSAEQRRDALLARSQETLADLPQTFGNQAFILSEEEAANIGEAIHTRDHRAIFDTVEGVLTPAMVDYEATGPEECIGLWNGAFSTVYGEGITLTDLLANSDTRELLNEGIAHSSVNQFGLETTEYTKLLETVAIATMPHTGFVNYPESRRSRTGGSERALYNRAIATLTGIADTAPGIRTIRENILATDDQSLPKYLHQLVRAHSAQVSLATIEELDVDDIRRRKAGISRALAEENVEHDEDLETLMHVLDWKMLTNREEDRATRHRRIRQIIEGQSVTEYQKRQVAQEWCPERLDFLIEIAEMARRDGRHPSMYISNRFEDGAGVYVAVELDNPHDPAHKMVFADNPINGNALYIVDELRLENEGRPKGWTEVLGASRRIARERGATRKYHNKNWQNILTKVMTMGDDHDTERAHYWTPGSVDVSSIVEPILSEVPTEEAPVVIASPESNATTNELIERSRALQARIVALARASNTLIKQ